MRNGNHEAYKYPSCPNTSSYPTYEEWKRRNCKNKLKRKEGSYPTYEEWKLKNKCSISISLCVLILPMRNGNMVIKLNFLS